MKLWRRLWTMAVIALLSLFVAFPLSADKKGRRDNDNMEERRQREDNDRRQREDNERREREERDRQQREERERQRQEEERRQREENERRQREERERQRQEEERRRREENERRQREERERQRQEEERRQREENERRQREERERQRQEEAARKAQEHKQREEEARQPDPSRERQRAIQEQQRQPRDRTQTERSERQPLSEESRDNKQAIQQERKETRQEKQETPEERRETWVQVRPLSAVKSDQREAPAGTRGGHREQKQRNQELRWEVKGAQLELRRYKHEYPYDPAWLRWRLRDARQEVRDARDEFMWRATQPGAPSLSPHVLKLRWREQRLEMWEERLQDIAHDLRENAKRGTHPIALPGSRRPPIVLFPPTSYYSYSCPSTWGYPTWSYSPPPIYTPTWNVFGWRNDDWRIDTRPMLDVDVRPFEPPVRVNPPETYEPLPPAAPVPTVMTLAECPAVQLEFQGDDLQLYWLGDETDVESVDFLLLDAQKLLIDRRLVTAAPFTAYFKRPLRLGFIVVTVRYFDAVETQTWLPVSVLRRAEVSPL
ncbi:MAG: hypothetical protein NZT92_06665 [Abditibacteriales bacterium]|nr:hypothetical protein [Abditibacteriales bacterium]MDW8365628.1 hypothetical protein [Abditibacteriales bacterium]